jgi:hypothetical protein
MHRVIHSSQLNKCTLHSASINSAYQIKWKCGGNSEKQVTWLARGHRCSLIDRNLLLRGGTTITGSTGNSCLQHRQSDQEVARPAGEVHGRRRHPPHLTGSILLPHPVLPAAAYLPPRRILATPSPHPSLPTPDLREIEKDLLASLLLAPRRSRLAAACPTLHPTGRRRTLPHAAPHWPPSPLEPRLQLQPRRRGSMCERRRQQRWIGEMEPNGRMSR